MSYYEDFIATAYHEWRAWRTMSAAQREAVRRENPSVADPGDQTRAFAIVAALAQASTVVRMGGEQNAVFLNTPAVEGQDFVQWLRLPFPLLYIHPTTPFRFNDYSHNVEADIARLVAMGREGEAELQRLREVERSGDPAIKGVQVLCVGREAVRMPGGQPLTVTDLLTMDGFDNGPGEPALHPDNLVRALVAHYLMPLPNFPLNMHSTVLFVTTDNQAVVRMRGLPKVRGRMRAWLLHLANFLCSPSIKLVRQEPSPQLQKARRASGKAPLAGWYELTYRRHVREYGPAKISPGAQWHHSFRYDVRGHFKRFEHGAMAGRVLWCPPHQRGLRNTLYRPKGYRQEGAAPALAPPGL